MQKEALSILIDGEMTDAVALNAISQDASLQKTWQRYHLIRDVMRRDIISTHYLDVSDRIAAALANEVSYNAEPHQVETLQSPPLPVNNKLHQFKSRMHLWGEQFLQFGIAASVGFLVIIGVQNYNAFNQDAEEVDPIILNTVPVGGFAAPVSYGVPHNLNDSQIRHLRSQRERIDAMLRDYQWQQPNAFSAEGSLSSGNHNQDLTENVVTNNVVTNNLATSAE